MTTVARFSQINGAAALLTTASADNGDEFAVQHVKRVFTAADIGGNAGQTRDAASNPTLGCLVAQFSGSRIRDIINLNLYRPVAGANVTNFNTIIFGTGANTTAIGWNVIYNAQTGISSIYILDTAAGAPGRIAAADWIEFDVLLGDSTTIPVAP